jgi:hypothetical protein
MNPEDINYDIMHSILTLILTYWQTGVWHLYWHNHWHIVWPVAWHPLWHIFRHWSERKYQHLIWQTSCDIDSEWFWRVFCTIFWHLTGQVFHVTLIWRHISICSDGTWCFVWCASHPMIGPYWPHIGPIWPHMAPMDRRFSVNIINGWGYFGKTSMYLPANIRQAAYNAEGILDLTLFDSK